VLGYNHSVMPGAAQLASEPSVFALSPLQQGLLFHALDKPGPGVDIVQVEGDFREELDAGAFARSWQIMAERYPILRTTFAWDGPAGPRQVVRPRVNLPVRIWRTEAVPAREAAARLEAFLLEEHQREFSLEEAPLLRVALFQVGAAHHRFVLTFHHLLLDLRAVSILLREVFGCYQELAAGREIRLPAPASYASYLQWVHALDTSAAESFWRHRLRGLTAATALPGETGARAATRPAASAEHSFSLGEAAMAQLRARAAEAGVTLNILVQAAWALLLSRHSGSDDVVFGAIRACRHLPIAGGESMVGLLINTVPVRVRVDAEAPLLPWLQALRRDWMELRAFEHSPLSQVQAWSELPPGQSLFSTLVNFQEPAWDEPLRALGGAWADRRFRVHNRPNYALAVDACARPTELEVSLLFDPQYFSAEAIARVAGHYRNLLEALGGAPTQTLGELNWLTGSERHELLGPWRGGEPAPPPRRCVHPLVERHAAARPERLAVSDARRSLTYGALNRAANRLARRLRAHGVGPDTLVAVCLPRSVDLVIAWLGVLKAGGAFVALDPTYPADRLAFLCRDSEAKLVVADSRTRSVLPVSSSGISVLELEAENDCSNGASEADLPLETTAAHLAYVIYTSGSTGRPKGVQIEHQALSRLIAWHQQAYGVGPDDRASQVASPAFDAAVWEIWPYLTAGASVHFPDEDTRLSPARLIAWIAAERITHAFLPTPLAEAVMSEPWPKVVLRALLTGGDRLRRRPPMDFPCPVFNHYGPTETTVVATASPVTALAVPACDPPIGRPITPAQTYVLDPQLRPVAVGVAGELFIGGEGVARGYWRRPELDRVKFVPDPFRFGSGARLYRTGDRVRWLPSGELEFLGRLDDQIKIRGHRIEPGEIEAALGRHPAVRQAVVIARSDRPGDIQLVAYLQPAPTTSVADLELGRFLALTLPEPMVPARFVWLAEWPLTAHGKIDRRALPAPPAPALAPRPAPRNPAEAKLVEIWQEVLAEDDLGIDDNFFARGGHSLLAARVMARIRAELGIELGVRALFDHPTVASLAVALGTGRRTFVGPEPAIRSRTAVSVRLAESDCRSALLP